MWRVGTKENAGVVKRFAASQFQAAISIYLMWATNVGNDDKRNNGNYPNDFIIEISSNNEQNARSQLAAFKT